MEKRCRIARLKPRGGINCATDSPNGAARLTAMVCRVAVAARRERRSACGSEISAEWGEKWLRKSPDVGTWPPSLRYAISLPALMPGGPHHRDAYGRGWHR